MDTSLIEAIEDSTTRRAIYALWGSAREAARDLDARLSEAEETIKVLRGTIAEMQRLEGRPRG